MAASLHQILCRGMLLGNIRGAQNRPCEEDIQNTPTPEPETHAVPEPVPVAN